nr:immunoglobulin heavy chain junction region [Macaca mulatta]MOW82287.1 immunoglobulin heavy chain junction region [Macaca mulatta]MOW82580.1 immunoglobulin heavy chain junction region [Macaca mulatta]MOW83043.1 immunoglobulin heavy chain junction region [Macaca mulatta]MOW83184.1 immunoglobulin heavy chain junction region [Macaca mulatta]
CARETQWVQLRGLDVW